MKGRSDLYAWLVTLSLAFMADAHGLAYDELTTSLGAARSSLEGLGDALENDHFEGPDGAFELASGDHDGSVANRLTAMNREIDVLQLQLRGVSGAHFEVKTGLQQFIDDTSSCDQLQTDLLERLATLFAGILTGEIDGPLNPSYIAQRNYLVNLLADLDGELVELLQNLDSFSVELSDVATVPAVQLRIVSVVSDTSGMAFITETNEQFTVTAVVRNLHAEDLDDIGLHMSISSPLGTLSLVSVASQTIGTLLADDGVAGSGPDQAVVQWQLAYSGALLDESSLVSVQVLESGQAPTSFIAPLRQRVLMVDPRQVDQDLDLMLDSWELENGLDTNLDDSLLDPDEDGLNNLQEHDLGTRADDNDSDDDDLKDGEETVAGVDGFVTDPLLADSDDDGLKDGEDDAPLDGGTSDASNPVPEPEVSVSQTNVILTNESGSANITVSNSGQGVLQWSITNSAVHVASTSVASGSVVSGEGSLVIGAAVAGHDFRTTRGLQATIKVIDVYGSDNDMAEIKVCHETCETVYDPARIFFSGFEW